MRIYILFFCSVLLFSFDRPESVIVPDSLSPLSTFSVEWNKPEYQRCNTAAGVDYLTDKEKQIVYILNLARMDPSLFVRTVVKQYPTYSGQQRLLQSDYYRSLVVFLENKKSLPLLYAQQDLYVSANCHAESSGSVGYVGHGRRTRDCKKVEKFFGECCHYGSDDPLEIVMDLLIDEGVPSLSHRFILFTSHTKIGVSLQPHRRYTWNTVLDLG